MERNTWPGWECVRELGRGSFGRVYEIRRAEFGRDYTAALKVIHIPQSTAELEEAYSCGMDEKSATEYFKSVVEGIIGEVDLMTELKGNTNIVSYEDHMVCAHEDDIGWDILIRMECLTPVLQLPSVNSMKEDTVLKLGCDICRALELCQRKHIIHRDVKPENIFVNDNGDFKLGDFGVARRLEHTMVGMSIKGTYNYMAPEINKGEAYNQTVDIYSLGMVLYRFLNGGRAPFLPEGAVSYSDREQALIRRMRGDAVPPPARGSQELKSAVLKAMAFRPEERYQTAAELRRELERCQAEGCQRAEWIPEVDELPVYEETVTLGDWGKPDIPVQDVIAPEEQVSREEARETAGVEPDETPPAEEVRQARRSAQPQKQKILLGALVLLVVLVVLVLWSQLKPEPAPALAPSSNGPADTSSAETLDETEDTEPTDAPAPAAVSGFDGLAPVDSSIVEALSDVYTGGVQNTTYNLQGVEWNTDTMESIYFSYGDLLVEYDLDGNLRQSRETDNRYGSLDYYDGKLFIANSKGTLSSGDDDFCVLVVNTADFEDRDYVYLRDISPLIAADWERTGKDIHTIIDGITVAPAVDGSDDLKVYVSYGVWDGNDVYQLSLLKEQIILQYDYDELLEQAEDRGHISAEALLKVDLGAVSYGGIQTLEYDRDTGSIWCVVRGSDDGGNLFRVKGNGDGTELEVVDCIDCEEASFGFVSLGHNTFFAGVANYNDRKTLAGGEAQKITGLLP